MFANTHVSARRSAFTLIEILVVVAIIALLISIFMPSLREARRIARRTLCLSNLHQISVALFSYQADYKGRPPQWNVYNEQLADGVALWVQGIEGFGHPTRLGMLYRKYIGSENMFFCPDARGSSLLHKEGGVYPWSNYGTDMGWAYGSYDYRPRYYFGPNGEVKWLGANYGEARSGTLSIASDAFSGWWEAFGPYPTHSSIESVPRVLYFNVAYMDGSARLVKDFPRPSAFDASAWEFGTRAAAPAQARPEYVTPPTPWDGRRLHLPPEYTYLKPGPTYMQNPLLPNNRQERNQVLSTTDHIERGWTFFDRR